MKNEYLKCERALDGKGGNIELITGVLELSADVCLDMVNESLRRHYASKWRQGFNTIVSIKELLSHKPSTVDKAIGIVSAMSTEDLIFLTELTPIQRHEYMKLDANAKLEYQKTFQSK